MDKHAEADVVAAAIAAAAADCGISLVASLPDGWITSLIERFEADARFRHVPVNREESAIGLCSGATFWRVRPIRSKGPVAHCPRRQIHAFALLGVRVATR